MYRGTSLIRNSPPPEDSGTSEAEGAELEFDAMLVRHRAKREQLKGLHTLLPERQGQNLALTALHAA